MSRANDFLDGKPQPSEIDSFLGPDTPKPASAARKMGDLGIGFASGAVGAIKSIADAAGAGNKASSVLSSLNTGINDYLSPAAKADQQEQGKILADASGKGAWEGVKAGARAFGVAPVQTAVQGLGSIVPILAGTALTGGAAPAAAVGAGIGAAMGTGTAKGAIYDEIKRRGGTEEEAIKAQEYGGSNTDQIALGGALGTADALTGVSKMAGNMLRNAVGKPVLETAKEASRGIISRSAMGLLSEMPLEAAQGGQEQVAANLAAQRAGYQAGTWDNVASNATMEALASAGPGAMFGAMDTGNKQTPPPPPPPAPQPGLMGLAPQPAVPEPVAPSVQMGIDPAAGVISKVAAQAVDTGTVQEIQLNQAADEERMAYEQAMAAQDQANAEQDSVDKPITSGPIAESQMSEEDKRAVLFSNQAVADGGRRHVGTQDGDILNGMGAPFATRMAAARRANMEGKDWTIAPVFDGFVARRKDAFNGASDGVRGASAGSSEQGSDQSAPGVGSGATDGNGMGADARGRADDAVGESRQSSGGVDDTAVGRPGYDTPVEIDARVLQGLYEESKGEQLVNKPEKLEAWRNGTSKTDPSKFPVEIGFRDSDGGLDVNDGRHRIALAAERGEKVRAFIDGKDAEKLNALVNNVQNTAPAANEPQATASTGEAAEAVASDAAPTEGVPGSGSAPVESAGVAPVTQSAQPGLPGQGAGVSQPTQTAPKTAKAGSKVGPASLGSAKADMDHLFGVDAKRKKAIERIAKGTAYFGTNLKAAQFIKDNGLKDTHEFVKTGASRFEVREKATTQEALQVPSERETRIASALANGGHVVGFDLRDRTGMRLMGLTPEEFATIPADKVRAKPSAEAARTDSTTKGNEDGTQAPQTQQAETQQPQEREPGQPVEEQNLQAAKNLLAQQKAATGNAVAEGAIRKKLRDLAAKTPISDAKTVSALDIAATRLGMGEGKLKGLEFAPAAAPVSNTQTADAPELSESTKARNLLMELQAKQDANGMVGDDRLETQINQIKREIAKLDGQNDELDAEMQSYEAKPNPTYSGEPARDQAGNVIQRPKLQGEDRFQYPQPLRNDDPAKTAAQARVVDYMNGDIDRPTLIKELEDSGLEQGTMFAITQRLQDDRFSIGEMDRLLERREKSSKAKTEPKVPVPPATPAPAAIKDVAVKANTVFTEDAAAAARARLKAKLSRLNTGVDPEMLMDGIILSGYHIEKGARTFVAYARAMIDDLGDGVKPYLKSWYMASKYDPRMAGMEGLDDAATMDAVNLDKLQAPEHVTTDEQTGVTVAELKQIAKKMADKKSILSGLDLGGQSPESLTISEYLKALGNGSSRPTSSSDEALKVVDSLTPADPEVKTHFTPADVAAAEKQAIGMLQAAIDKMKAQEAQRFAARFLPTMGVNVPVGKARINAAMNDPKINLLAAADALNVSFAKSIVDALEAKQEGRVADVVEQKRAEKPAQPVKPDNSVKPEAKPSDSQNKRHTISKAEVLTPAGSLKADATNSKADSSVWYYQGDMDRLQFVANVTVNGQPDKGADEAKLMLEQIKAIRAAGWSRRNMRAGSMGTVWLYEKDDKFLTRAGMENAANDVMQRPAMDLDTAGYENMVLRQKTLAKAFVGWLDTLPREQQENRAVVVRKMNDTPVSTWARIIDDGKLGVSLQYILPNGSWSIKFTAPDFDALIEKARKLADSGKSEDETQSPADEAPADVLDAEKSLWGRIGEGAATVDEFKAGFENWVNRKDEIISTLMKSTKDQLLKMRGFMYDRYKNEPKSELVDAMWRDGTTRYVLSRSFSHGMGKNAWLDGIRNMVENTDADQLAQYAQQVKANTEEAVARVGKIAEAIKDPQTLEDYLTVMRAYRASGKSFKESRMMLTPEQRAKYDDLTAADSRSKRKSTTDAQRSSVAVAGQLVDGNIIATKHTKKNTDLFVVQLAERVSKEDYDTLNAGAKRIGGYYSSYRGAGAVPGFTFTDRAQAEAFVKLAQGDNTDAQAAAQANRDSFEDDRSQTATQRLNEMADRLEGMADASLNQERKANTSKRAQQAASAEAAANADKAMAKTMRNLADAISNGTAKFLDRVRQKVQVAMLQGYVATAKGDELRAKYASYSEQERHKGEPPTMETADYAEFPTYTASRSNLASLARQLLDVDGTKLLGQRLLKEADDVTDAYLAFAKENLLQVSAFRANGGGLAAFGSKAAAEASIARSGYKGKAIAYQVKRGQHTVILSPSEAIERGIWQGDGDTRITLHPDTGSELVEKIGKAARRGAKVAVPWQLETAHDRRKALTRMGIETPAEFRAALREFIGLLEQAQAPSKVKELERAMIGRRNDGMDFFPTPESVADEMVSAAGIEPGMAVLEPSAGWGHIAERIRAMEVEPDVIELSGDRRELLEAKGFNVVANDFTGLTTEDLPNGVGYDRILMNPPFSDGRDIQHVQHAYTLLKPGGRIVAIMGESAFTNQNKRATEFREWLESVGGTEEKLAEGTFTDPSLPVNTGANARMVVIEKLNEADPAAFSRPTFSRGAQSQANESVERLATGIASHWENAPKVVVAFDMNDPIIPENVRKEDQRQRSGGATGTPEGFYYKGVVYLMSSKLGTPNDVARVLFHEALGHAGLRGAFGGSLEPILREVSVMRRAEVDAKLKQYGLKGINKIDRLIAAEEVLAELAQTRPELGFVKRAIAAIRTWLRQNVPGFASLRLSDAELIRNYILPARRFVENGGGPKGGVRVEPTFSRGADQTQSEEFKKWFADSKVTDPDGKPLVVYHGTSTDIDFSVFRGEKFYFSPNPAYAGQYADGGNIPGFPKANSRVLPVYLSVQKPIDLTAFGTGDVAFPTLAAYLRKQGLPASELTKIEALAQGDRKPVWMWMHFDTLRLAIQEAGFDGVIQQENNGISVGVAYIVFKPTQVKSAIGNTGDFDAENPDIRFSRTLGETLTTAANNVHDVNLPAGYTVGDLLKSAPGKVSWWHKTVGTMYNLAERSPQFKRVFDGVQNFINDVSYYATEAADLAPNILPKLETWKDIGKSPLSAEDTKAISAPIFEGTLTWARDEQGKPIKIEALEAQAATLTPEQKAQRLLRNDKVSDQVLKMWQGLPLDQYESIIEGKYERDMLKAGVVWTPAELRAKFNLTGEKQSDGTWDGQIGLYQEFRKATDKSLTNLAISDMLRFGGKDVEPIRNRVLSTDNVVQAGDMLRDYLLEMSDMDPARKDVLLDTANKMVEKADKAQDLIARGYAPLSRYGQFTLDVVDRDGERVYFGMFESKIDAARMARRMEQEYPGATITRGTVSEEEYKLFAGVSPETLELFGDMLGLEAQGDSAASKAFQTYLKLAKSNRSSMKRMIQRKGIAGFSEDSGRVLAGFVYSNARQTASNLHMGEMTDAANEVAKTQGELKDQAVRLVDYVKNPREEAQAFRGLLFAQYIGGSVASAMVNMTQPFAMTFPWLSQYTSVADASKQMASAMKDANRKHTGDTRLDAALKRAEEDGTVSPQEVHQLMQQSQGRGALRSGDGTKAGDVMAAANNALSRFSLGWGKLFSLAEQFNRRATFIAAYRTAVAKGIDAPEAFARKAIAETQGIYNKGNKPNWARGAVGSTLFTFKQYSIAYVEMLHRMATQGGPEGKKAAMLALAVLFLMSGAGGMPGGDDLDDLISGIMQRLGYNYDSKTKRQEFFASIVGEGGAQFLERGVSGLPGVPLDVSGRLGMGNLIPGTGIAVPKADHTRDVTEIIGPAGDFAKRGFDAAGKVIEGDVLGLNGAARTVAPKAFQNLVQAFDMANMGMYRDAKGMKVLDTGAADSVLKAIGFQPNDVKKVQDASFETQRMIGLNKLRETEIANRWALGIFEKDSDKVKAAREELAQWNATNPESPIRINFKQILQRVQKMNQTKAERITATAPKEIRADVRRALDVQ